MNSQNWTRRPLTRQKWIFFIPTAKRLLQIQTQRLIKFRLEYKCLVMVLSLHGQIVHLQEYVDIGEPQAFDIFSKDLITSLERIRKRLGGQRFKELRRIMLDALLSHRRGDPEQHKLWITALLTEYYDPMYEHQMKQRDLPPIFRGNQREVTEFLLAQCG